MTMPLDAHASTRVATQPAAADAACIRVQQPRWAVLATYPQAEAWAEQNLRQRGYTPFLPRYAARIRDRVTPTLIRTTLRPLFAGYIFVQHDPADPWRPIRYCPGIRANLIGGQGVQYARAGDVSVLEASEALRRSIAAPGASWAPGMPCSPVAGTPFAGHPAVVLSVERQTARVAMLLFGELRTVSIDIVCLRARDE